MGAWGTGTFDNDDALDWVYELQQSNGLSFVVESLQAVTNHSGYLEARDSQRALAAAEVVAQLKHAERQDLPEEVNIWITGQNATADSQLTQLALLTLERVRTDSELKELWDEVGKANEWHSALGTLENRLRTYP